MRVTPVSQGTGDMIRLRLDGAAAGLGWRQINVGRAVLRSERGQHRLRTELFSSASELDVSLPAEGCALLTLDVGPPAARGHPDSWRRVTQCSKVIRCTGRAASTLEARRGSGALLTAKTGSRVELRPLVNPTLARPGSDLPVIVYAEGLPQQAAPVVAHGPDETVIRATTDRVGAAVIRLTHAGLWRLVYQHGTGRSTRTAELIFAVSGDELWRERER